MNGAAPGLETDPAMPSILHNLPGISMPVSHISRNLRQMWMADPGTQDTPPSDFRASQLNLVIHLGEDTSTGEALAIFTTGIHFGQRYPCRIVMLCPQRNGHPADAAIESKLFTQCYIGDTHRQMCCCEVIMLGYDPAEPHMLFNLVSIWLESDLPVFHWFHRVPENQVRNRHLSFVRASRRVIFDSGIDSIDLRDIPTPDPSKIHDLAAARTLPIRQSVGQILSTYDPSEIIRGIRGAHLLCHPKMRAEAVRFSEWIEDGLKQCVTRSGSTATVPVSVIDSPDHDSPFEIRFDYADDTRIFSWRLLPAQTEASIRCRIGTRSIENLVSIRLPDSASTLAETMFFG